MKEIITRLAILLLVSIQSVSAQDAIDTIVINDASFKQQATYWKDCGFSEPIVGLQRGLGRAYKMIRQELSKPLLKNKCYAFSLRIKQSKAGQAGMDFPNIRVWGGKNLCQRSELLAITGPVAYMAWNTYEFQLHPTQDYQFIVIEAYTKPRLNAERNYFSAVKDERSYSGHVVMGDISNLIEIQCPEEDLPIKEVEPVAKKAKKVIMPELKKKVTKGQVMRLRNLGFDANSSKLLQGGQSVLDELFNFLKGNPSVNVELGGHTNNLCDTPYCNSLSEKRAKKVADYLINKGINSNRLKFKGYGKTNPIATNSTAEGRKTNQRVEVKILSQ